MTLNKVNDVDSLVHQVEVEDQLIADSTDPRKANFQTILFALKLLLAVAIVYWLVMTGRFDISAYRQLMSPSAVYFLIAALLTQALSVTIVLGRWWVLLKAQNIQITLLECLKVSYQGTFMGLFLPGTIGTDGIRFLHLQKNFREQLALGIASLTLDRALGFLGLLILSVGFGILFFLSHRSEFSMYILVIMIGFLLGTLLIIGIACGYIPLVGEKLLRKIRLLAVFIDSLTAYRTKRTELIIVVLLSLFAHFLVTLGACFGLMALNIEFSFLAVATVTPLLIFVRFIPLTPMGLGVSDAVAEELYTMAGIAGGAENQMLLRATWVVFLLFCGLSFFSKTKK